MQDSIALNRAALFGNYPFAERPRRRDVIIGHLQVVPVRHARAVAQPRAYNVRREVPFKLGLPARSGAGKGPGAGKGSGVEFWRY